MPAELNAHPAIRFYKFTTATRQVSLRNTGGNTLWVSFDRVNWVDIAAGTSFDDRFVVHGFWYHTQLGTTLFVVNGVSLNMLDTKHPKPTPEEAG